MKEYITTGVIRGEERKLLVLHPMEGLYRVYWDAHFLGTIEPITHYVFGLYWDTDSAILEDCCQELGEYIESCT